MILKNAVAYITRKKNRTFIIFIVLVLILSSLYSCLSIMGLNNSVEKNLYKLSNSAISVMLNSEQNFNIDKFKNINNIKGIEEKYFQYDGVGKLVNYKVVESEQGVSRDDVPEDLKNLVSICAFNNMKKNNLFSSGVFNIKSGRNIENGDTNKVIIHEDLALKNELANSEKDKSELLMIVDLERNDLNRICELKSVVVDELFEVETYSTVFHLVSTIRGKLKEEYSFVDLIKATFPGGSITGAPKIRAMEIIDELENSRRDLYTGSIGYVSFNGDCDLNIVIRTAIHKDGKYYLGVGGGITCESELEFEYEETLQKAKAILEAIC